MSNVGYSKYNLDLVYTVLILLLNQGMYEYKDHRNLVTDKFLKQFIRIRLFIYKIWKNDNHWNKMNEYK